MSKIKQATDSTADIPRSFCEELNISVLPLMILAGEKEYCDGVDITPSEFYRIIDESKELPVYSQVSTVLIMDKPPIAEYQIGCAISINTGPNMIGILYLT